MVLDDILKFKKQNNSDLFIDFEIKKLNWFNIGGKSKIFFRRHSSKRRFFIKKCISLPENSLGTAFFEKTRCI